MQDKRRFGWWTGFAPALPFPKVFETFQASLGGVAGIATCFAVAVLAGPPSGLHLYLIAPLGASAVLVFMVPNSPLAQPWSAITGNTVAAACGVLAVGTLPLQLAPLASVAMAFAAMLLSRALHPPGGAVALLVGLDPSLVESSGALGVCLNAALMTTVLVLAGVVFHRFSGRKYPFRNSFSTASLPQAHRLGLTEEELAVLLSRFHQSTNLGAVDLARLLMAAEMDAIHHRFEGANCATLARKVSGSVTPGTAIHDLYEHFAQSGLPLLPVVRPDGVFVGAVSQKTVLAELSRSTKPRIFAPVVRVRDLAQTHLAVFDGKLPLGEAVHHMMEANLDIAAVTENGLFAGFLTRSDLLEAILLPVRNTKAA